MGPDQKVRVGDQSADSTEAVDSTSRLVKKFDHLLGERESPRGHRWEERPIAFGRLADVAAFGRSKGIWPHAPPSLTRLPELSLTKAIGVLL